MGFIVSGGNCCRSDDEIIVGKIEQIGNDTKDRVTNTIKSVNNLLMNEILRGLAQILYNNGDRLQIYREIILETLLEHCDYRSVDIDSRHAAVDAIASVLVTPLDIDALNLIDSDENKMPNSDVNSPLIKQLKSQKANTIYLLHDKCEHAIIDNLQSSINMAFAISNLSQSSTSIKFLVSCLRALAQIIDNNAKQKEFDRDKKHVLEMLMKPQPAALQRFQSLIQSAYMIFEKLLSKDRKPNNNSMISSIGSSGYEAKLVTHTFNFLGSLASFNPNAFVSSWQLFLSDLPSIDMALQNKISKYLVKFDALDQDNREILGTDIHEVSVFRSPIFSTAYKSQQPFVRASAIKCIRLLLKGLPLHKWFRNSINKKDRGSVLKFSLGTKIISTVTKIFHFVIMMLKEEEELLVIEELLSAAKLLVLELPMMINKSASNANSISSTDPSNIENLGKVLFQILMHRAIQIKPDPVDVVKVSISDCILKWLTDCSKGLPSLLSFDKALSSNCYMKYHIFNQEKAATSNDNWRQIKPKLPSPITDIFEKGQFPRILAKIILDLSGSSSSVLTTLCSACRDLIEVIILKYNSRIMSDSTVNDKGISWLRTFVDSLTSHAIPAFRLLGYKIVSTFLIISKSSPSTTFRMVGCYNTIDVTNRLMSATVDNDHQIRGQAYYAFGLYCPVHWQELDKQSNSKISIIRRILEGCMDQIGTVRASSFKSIGDAILNGALDVEIKKLPESNEISILEIIKKLHVGCKDSKLAVRIQAVWSLGSILLLVLPLRQQDNCDIIECICDDVWISHGDICLRFFEDSDKIIPSSVRCIGFIAAGLVPWNAHHFSLLIAYIEALMTKIFISPTESDVEQCIQKAVCELPSKFLFSVCQALSFIGWVLVNKHEKKKRLSTKALEYACPNDDQLYAAMNRISLVLSIMLRYGTTKIQLHACKALVSFGGDYTSVNRFDENDIKLIYPRSFIVCFESTFTVLSSIVKQSTMEIAIAKNSTQHQRSLSLNRCLVFLMWSNLVTIGTISNDKSSDDTDLNIAKSIIAYYIDELLQWLIMTKATAIATDIAIINNEQFSLTPVINTSTELVGLPVSVENLVYDIAKKIWIIVQSLNEGYNNTGVTNNSMSKLISFIKESNPIPSPTKSINDNDNEDEI